MEQPRGKILVTGASRSGKSYFAAEFKKMGLQAIDIENEVPGIVRWCSDEMGEPVEKPKKPSPEWYHTNHFIIDIPRLKSILDREKDCIILGHAWNILDCLNLFDKIYLLYVPPEELERRLDMIRGDHGNHIPTEAGKAFARQKHADRLQDAKRLNIPLIDATITPEELYKILLEG